MIARKYRNRRIGEFLKELKLTEGRNTGVPKIKRALKNNGSKEPEFETNETRDYFITTIFMHDGFENEISNKIKISDKTSDKILNYLQQNEYITTTIASELLGLSIQRARAILGKMAKKEMIIAEGANKNRKYRLNGEKL
jgi:ATP-dependent DNA helicase RecG